MVSSPAMTSLAHPYLSLGTVHHIRMRHWMVPASTVSIWDGRCRGRGNARREGKVDWKGNALGKLC